MSEEQGFKSQRFVAPGHDTINLLESSSNFKPSHSCRPWLAPFYQSLAQLLWRPASTSWLASFIEKKLAYHKLWPCPVASGAMLLHCASTPCKASISMCTSLSQSWPLSAGQTPTFPHRGNAIKCDTAWNAMWTMRKGYSKTVLSLLNDCNTKTMLPNRASKESSSCHVSWYQHYKSQKYANEWSETKNIANLYLPHHSELY